MKKFLQFFFLVVLVSGGTRLSLAQESSKESGLKFPELCINGIIFDEADRSRSLVIIGNESLGEGDAVRGAVIAQIEKSSVIFTYQEATFQKELGEDCRKARELIPRKSFEEVTKQLPFGLAPDRAAAFPLRPGSAPGPEAILALAIVGVILAVAYIWGAFTLHRIAKKTNTGRRWMAWLPILQPFLMCMVTHRPMLWGFLILFLPVTIIGIIPALIMAVIVLTDIAAACGKPKWLVLLLLLPGINGIGWFIFWGYLAFSKIDSGPGVSAQGQSQPVGKIAGGSGEPVSSGGHTEGHPTYQG